MKLPYYRVLRVTGDDATIFLQGQLTADIASLAVDDSLFSGYCNRKGRLYASMHVWYNGEAYYLIMHHSLCDNVFKRLTFYKMRAQVALDILQDRAVYSAALGGAGFIPLYPGAERGYTLSPNDDTVLPEAEWDLDNVKDKFVPIKALSSGLFLPQVLGYQHWQAVSFDKGCYVGQEVVARTQHLGKLKKQVVQAKIPQALVVGERLDDPVGQVALCASQAGDYNALLVVSVNSSPLN